MKHCLSKEREAWFNQQPTPDLVSLVPPKVDKCIMDFLDKRLSKELYTDLSQIQGAVLAAAQPLTSICMKASDRMGPELAEDQEMVVPAAEVSYWTESPPACEQHGVTGALSRVV